ncbi:hypothetical protein MPC4_20305 [Methylocella tundrae]|uniref:Uncharacterized protein n=1 Tax=Methylocella tundrae TaxID=227605 RepID=A0A8B6M5H9_METTU|nr:hypothetical protein MPC4_20305 [Methylocella tundrae]
MTGAPGSQSGRASCASGCPAVTLAPSSARSCAICSPSMSGRTRTSSRATIDPLRRSRSTKHCVFVLTTLTVIVGGSFVSAQARAPPRTRRIRLALRIRRDARKTALGDTIIVISGPNLMAAPRNFRSDDLLANRQPYRVMAAIRASFDHISGRSANCAFRIIFAVAGERREGRRQRRLEGGGRRPG